MKPWSDFYDGIMPELPGCPRVAVDNALRQSAIEFCEQSLAWRASHPEVFVAAGTPSYAFSPPEGALVHAISHASLDGGELETRSSGCGASNGTQDDGQGAPRCILGGATHFTLVPKPVAAGILIMTVILKPSVVSTGIDDLLFTEYRESIIHGALARLMLSPKKPYSNVQLAPYHERQFAIKTGVAGVRAANSHGRAALRTTQGRRGGWSRPWA